ncbi:hypothetical protein AHIS1_p051 [Acaryochloris phage A-HIS1]|nr:hypothetical protein AHIS1_p051 [Acaryochloris phage A-HIS1]
MKFFSNIRSAIPTLTKESAMLYFEPFTALLAVSQTAIRNGLARHDAAVENTRFAFLSSAPILDRLYVDGIVTRKLIVEIGSVARYAHDAYLVPFHNMKMVPFGRKHYANRHAYGRKGVEILNAVLTKFGRNTIEMPECLESDTITYDFEDRFSTPIRDLTNTDSPRPSLEFSSFPVSHEEIVKSEGWSYVGTTNESCENSLNVIDCAAVSRRASAPEALPLDLQALYNLHISRLRSVIGTVTETQYAALSGYSKDDLIGLVRHHYEG